MKVLTSSIAIFSVFVSPALAQGNVIDDFTRQETNSLGVARSGSTWQNYGDATFSVDGGNGVVDLGGSYKRGHAITNFGNADLEAIAAVSIPGPITGGYLDAGVTARNVYEGTGSLTGYRAAIRFSDSNTRLVVTSIDRNTVSTLGTANLPIQALPGEKFNIKFSATGVNPTLLRAKLWQAGAPEPTDWHIIKEDNSPRLQQTNGFAGISAATSSTYTGSTPKAHFDHFSVRKCANGCSMLGGGVSQSGFTANVLDTYLNMQWDTNGTVTTTYDFTQHSETVTHIQAISECAAVGVHPKAKSNLIFKNVSDEIVYRQIGCDYSGHGSVATSILKDSDLIPIPKDVTKVTITSELANVNTSQFNRAKTEIVVYGE